MTQFEPRPNADGLVKLSGTIHKLKATRRSASFVLTASDQGKLGIVAIAAALAGIDGQAGAAIHSANDMEEAADYLEFEIDGQPVKGWVWRNPFKEGDAVSVAAGKAKSHWEAYGIARSKDKTVALYPHCSRGRSRHYKNALKWWVLGGGGGLTVIGIPLGYAAFQEDFLTLHGPWIAYASLMAFFGLMTFSLTRKWLPFVRVAEKVFRALGLPDPSNIDLIKSSKGRRTPDDPPGYGTFYFRY